MYPPLVSAAKLTGASRRLFIGAYGFEDRQTGWCCLQGHVPGILKDALVFKYKNPKGKNRIRELRAYLESLGADIGNLQYDTGMPQPVEDEVSERLSSLDYDEVVVDISAMTKLLILLVLCKLENFSGVVRIIYSEAETYLPSESEYNSEKKGMAVAARYPSRGVEQVIRLRCLNSIRMQGQPVALVAFASFNEQLVSHMLGSISPRRLLLINGRPPRRDFAWRERATQDIHGRLWQEYDADNPLDNKDLLKRYASTLDYRETIERIDEIYKEHGQYERIICAATGSKMQAVGLACAKFMHPDIQVEYPTPDSYYIKEMTSGVRQVHEILIRNFSSFVNSVHESS
ncbi:MAG: hypothetical protein MN733_37790 [Nitrososphaera sp.]|nr:hypothetical protein [Nitrososphaera sp.]